MICNCCEKNKALPDNVWCTLCMEHNSQWSYDKANTAYLVEKWSNCMILTDKDDLKQAIIVESEPYQKI